MMKLKTPTELVAHYKIATPMFLGGENQRADNTQFRNASLKGALRFWWRALNWGAALRDVGNQEAQALSLLHEREGRLFGLASDSKHSRQSCVQIHSELRRAMVSVESLPNHIYLLGMGLYKHNKGMLRDYMQGGNLTIRLTFKPNTKEEDVASVQQAAIALGIFGGLGSRSRKGFGSLALQKIELPGKKDLSFTTEESILNFVQGLDFSAPADAPFSALTRATRIDISTIRNSALDALADINKEQQLYRSYGKNGKVGNIEARRNFKADHDNVYDTIHNGATLQKIPERAVFGLPHNYRFSSEKELSISAENPSLDSQRETKEGRRASPLLVHIHILNDGKFIVIQTLFQSEFLHSNIRITIDKRPKEINKIVNFSVIHRYMDGFSNKKTLKAAQQ